VPAHAYIDPGTGSALIQGLIAATAAVGITLKLYWHRIVAFIGRRKSKESPSTSEALGHRESHKPT
jgi:hypothetical protein